MQMPAVSLSLMTASHSESIYNNPLLCQHKMAEICVNNSIKWPSGVLWIKVVLLFYLPVKRVTSVVQFQEIWEVPVQQEWGIICHQSTSTWLQYPRNQRNPAAGERSHLRNEMTISRWGQDQKFLHCWRWRKKNFFFSPATFFEVPRVYRLPQLGCERPASGRRSLFSLTWFILCE